MIGVGKHSQPDGPRWWLPALMGLLVVLVGGFGVSRIVSSNAGPTTADGSATASAAPRSSSSASSSPSSSAASSSPTSPAPTTSAGDPQARAALVACVTTSAAAEPLVQAASTGIGHWKTHVQGQTDIESGARSKIDVKVNSWAPTRKAGPGDAAAFDKARREYAAAPGCSPPQTPATGDLGARLSACDAHQRALTAYVDTASAAMADWAAHLTEMGAHADGHVDSVQAQEAWLSRWRAAPTHITPFLAAETALRAAPACTA